MTRSKLSDTNKQEIVQQFRESPATIAELAQQYDVSGSTIRRVLKQQLSASDYNGLVATKQDRGTPKSTKAPKKPIPKPKLAETSPKAATSPDSPTKYTDQNADTSISDVPETSVTERPILAKASRDINDNPDFKLSPGLSTSQPPSPSSPEDPNLVRLLAEIEDDLEEDDLDDLEEDEDLDEDLDDLEEDDDLDGDNEDTIQLRSENIEICPLTDAAIPIPCYLVVDRSAELITCPLKSFADLGKIPEAESQAKTLPVFENHRVARRFSHRSQRIIKVPNGDLLKKTEAHLQAKGITRLLIKGRVYAL